ncbi:MAG: DUF3786 domain-containing protein [Termitinemataceae bacterium]|nr:MAG: DUF3786 domain-containing protein [Termitinemataceae bacterium]
MRSDWKEIPFEHYACLFKELKPFEAAHRTNIIFDEYKSAFLMRYFGKPCAIIHPKTDFIVEPEGEMLSISEKILLLRYLCEGKWEASAGRRLSYREIPWGEVYYKNFEGRCLGRLARVFGGCPELFARVFEESPPFDVEKITGKEYAYRFEFISNLYLSFQIWPGDDEFPASAQILFDDNVCGFFSAEDLAVVCESLITRLKARAAALGTAA